MRKHPRVSARPSVEQCFCSSGLGFVCSLHRGESAKKSANNELRNDNLAYSPDLTGYGYRTGYSLNPDGEEVSPEQDKEEEFMRAVTELFSAVVLV